MWPRNPISELCSLPVLLLLLMMIVGAWAEPGYQQASRNAELEPSDSLLDVETADSMEHPAAAAKPPRTGPPSARYGDYDYYTTGRRPYESTPGDNELSASSSIRLAGEEQNGGYMRKPALDMPAKPWYGPYTGKSIAMYPSRSYDPYIRRYDRFDEQYHRAYPPYYEDMYVHRQRFDPYDSYSPRVPQYPEPYLMYPDRQLDTPPVRDYLKARRGYMDDPRAVLDPYSNKYVSPKLPQQLVSPRNERVVYYAHLPEIVRTPYDTPLTRPDRNGPPAALVAQSAAFKPNKKKLKSLPRVDNSTNYKPVF